jgi:hypothetical protein
MQKEQLRRYESTSSYFIERKVVPVGDYPVPHYLKDFTAVESYDGHLLRYRERSGKSHKIAWSVGNTLNFIRQDKMSEALSGHYHPCMSPNCLFSYLGSLLKGGFSQSYISVSKLSKIEPNLPIWEREPSITR